MVILSYKARLIFVRCDVEMVINYMKSRGIQPMLKAYLIWGVSLLAMAGSLFFSDVMKLPPCSLCWYQRIAMYPLVLLCPVFILSNNVPALFAAVWSLVFPGLLIAGYHNLLYYNFIEGSIIPCASGVSCTSRQIEWFGFVTIPLLSLTAFVLIFLILVIKSSDEIKEGV